MTLSWKEKLAIVSLVILWSLALILTVNVYRDFRDGDNLTASNNRAETLEKKCDELEIENKRLSKIVEQNNLVDSSEYIEKIAELEKDLKESTDKIDELNNKIKELKENLEIYEIDNEKSLGYYSVYVNADDDAVSNIVNAAELLDGRLFKSNRNMSINSIIGPYNSSNGYVCAPSNYTDGLDYLGEAIYKAATKSDLLISSYSINNNNGYVAIAQNCDLSIRNNKPYDIVVHTKYKNGTLEVYFMKK